MRSSDALVIRHGLPYIASSKHEWGDLLMEAEGLAGKAVPEKECLAVRRLEI